MTATYNVAKSLLDMHSYSNQKKEKFYEKERRVNSEQQME